MSLTPNLDPAEQHAELNPDRGPRRCGHVAPCSDELPVDGSQAASPGYDTEKVQFPYGGVSVKLT